MTRHIVVGALLAGSLLAQGAAVLAQTRATEYEGAAALGLALRQLGTSPRVLMIGAHPDDESTQILSTLALGQGAEVAYLSLTRGEGGQNGIGPELQEGLGILRSEELLAARRLDGARQFFTRAYDFGFSKNAEEAFRHWPRDSVLADVVAVVRSYRPDVILSVFSGTPRDGHGHHQVAGIMAHEVYEAAADPTRFPDQVARGLAPHATAKLYQALWRADEEAEETLSTGEVDPLLGRSYYQVAMASRSLHRSQDMGSLLEPGPHSSNLRLISSRVSEDNGESGLFAGVDTTLAMRVAPSAAAVKKLLEEYDDAVRGLRKRYNPLTPGELLPGLLRAHGMLEAAEAASAGELRSRVAEERTELEAALALSARVRFDAVADRETVVPGDTIEVEVSVWNGGEREMEISSLAPGAPDGWRVEPLTSGAAALPPNTLQSRRFAVIVPADASPTEPYYLQAPRVGDLYTWPEGAVQVGPPFQPPLLQARAELRVDQSTFEVRSDATYRAVDKMQGEIRRPLRVVPGVSLLLDPAVAIVPLAAGDDRRPLRFSVRMRAGSPRSSGILRLSTPPGWRVEPEATAVDFSTAEEQAVEFTVWPAADLAAGSYSVDAELETADGSRFTRGYELVDYPHTRPRPLYRPARAQVAALDVRLPADLRVGYVAGAGDAVPAALRELGLAVELLGPEALASADLATYDVIVTGIRAYEVRPDLTTHNQRLLDYVREGGTMLVQYNKYEYTEPGIAPYPVTMDRPHDRVTDESAAVALLQPEHPALSWPNRINAADFQGWVQERGLYFLDSWDERYTPLLEMSDPGEEGQRGALLVAPYGEGTYVYTGLAFFRQLPAGVPGAYRLFANLLSLGSERP